MLGIHILCSFCLMLFPLANCGAVLCSAKFPGVGTSPPVGKCRNRIRIPVPSFQLQSFQVPELGDNEELFTCRWWQHLHIVGDPEAQPLVPSTRRIRNRRTPTMSNRLLLGQTH
ncbi:hypothetical protein M5D96_010117 [Drosophila gunungcola]|uniref:Secreted protein n=1 Tax=Drosophila gunungcola TaxID=103775 RepID=A0A9P9YH35_9MUSC|nr:hypothetical protein M5D96_010117 [Drosophila gunungcola]